MRAILLTAIAIIFLFTLTAQVEGADWEKINEDSETIVYLDLNSITKLPDNHYKALDKIIYKDPSSKFSQMLSYMEYDCDNNRYRNLQITGYYGNGGISGDTEIKSWRYVIQDSAWEIQFTLVCNNYRGNLEKIIENENDIFYIDRDSIKKLPNNHYMVWEKLDVKDTSSEIDFWITYTEYDCVKKRRNTPIVIGYSKDGLAGISSVAWTDAPLIALKIICNRQSKGGEKK